MVDSSKVVLKGIERYTIRGVNEMNYMVISWRSYSAFFWYIERVNGSPVLDGLSSTALRLCNSFLIITSYGILDW